jgi:hypothetical protein
VVSDQVIFQHVSACIAGKPLITIQNFKEALEESPAKTEKSNPAKKNFRKMGTKFFPNRLLNKMIY